MKKIIVIFLIILSVFSFAIAYNQTAKEENNNIQNIENNIAKQFVIPNDTILSTPEEIYPILYETANECKVNIFRTNINYTADDKAEIIKYVLLTKDTAFFDTFRLRSGRFLNEKDIKQDRYFMSTLNTNDKNQIGVIKNFGNNNLVLVKPLKTSYENLPVYGKYFVEVSNEKAFNIFINALVTKVNKNFKTSYSLKDFTKKSSDDVNQETSSSISLQYIYYITIIIVMILLVYYIFSESKKIGIIKMHGVSNIRLWFIVYGKVITIIFILAILVLLPLTALVKDTTFKFVYNTILYQFENYIIMIAISLVSYIYISKIKLSHIIKNRKDTNGIFVLNIILKVCGSIILILLCCSILSQYEDIHNKQETLKNWQYSKDYGVFYPVNIGNDQQDLENNLPIFTFRVNAELYPVLNKMGSVLINSKMYEEKALILDKNDDGIRSVTVNTNYLRQFSVLDANNRRVQVAENTTNWALLVPEKYRNKESQIREFFKKDRVDSMDYDKSFFKTEVPDDIKNQQINIIWTENNQKIFSFNPEVFKSENNIIVDPIIQVITEKNSLLTDKSSILGGGCSDPLKIKLINRDTSLTYKTLEPELIKLKLDDNLKHLITVNQFVLQEIYDLKNQVNSLLIISLGLILVLLILIVQNLSIFFNKYKRKFIVRKLFGTGFFRTYKEFSLLFSISCGAEILISSILNKAFNMQLIEVALIIILIELITSVIALVIIERRNMVKVLKGGMN